jgi:hypothetical protein
MNFDTAALAYVRYVLAELDLKPGALARKSGISASTLTRALNDPNHKFKLSMTTLEKIAEFSGVNVAPFLQANDTAELTLADVHDPQILRPSGENTSFSHFKVTMVIGAVAANQWFEPGPVNWMDYGPLMITHSTRSPKDCFCFVVQDKSADMIADSGDFLFCTRPRADVDEFLKENPKSSSVGAGPVLVERRSKDAFKVEHTARLIRRRMDRSGGWELISAHRADHFPRSDETKKKKPLIQRVLLDDYYGNDEIRVIGEVELVVRGDTGNAIDWLLSDTKR